MAGLWPGAWKDHAPGDICGSAPQFRLDEICDAPKKNTDGRDERANVGHREGVDGVALAKQPNANGRASKAAMKRHAAFPNREDAAGIVDEKVEIVEQDVAEPPAEDDAEGDINEEIVEAFRRRAGY